jgi:hypothetical protein
MTSDDFTSQLDSYLADAIQIDNSEAKMAILNLTRDRNSALSVTTLLVEQASRLEAKESSNAASDYLEDIHTGLSSLAARAPITHTHLVDLIELLHKRKEKIVQVGFFGSFGMQHGDYHRYLESDSDQAEKYININSFEARLWSRLGRDFGHEVTSDPIEKLSRSVEASLPDNHGFQTVDAKISTVCMWMLHVGPAIWSLSRQEDKNEIGNQFRGCLWKDGKNGYSMARWEFWLERFSAISRGDGPEVTVETRGYASAAARVMRELQEAEGV